MIYFPTLALRHFPVWLGLIFIVGLISALFPSADGALTALTASTCIDLIGIRERGWSDAQQRRVRQRVHAGIAVFILRLCHVVLPAARRFDYQFAVRTSGYHVWSAAGAVCLRDTYSAANARTVRSLDLHRRCRGIVLLARVQQGTFQRLCDRL